MDAEVISADAFAGNRFKITFDGVTSYVWARDRREAWAKFNRNSTTSPPSINDPRVSVMLAGDINNK
jgi:hypothetical protein